MEATGYGFHHESEDGKYLIMANGSRAFAIPNGDTPEHTAPEKLTVLVVEPMKEPYVKEIAPGLCALQAEVGGDIAASYPFDDPVGLVLNDEGKLIGLDLNRSLRDEHGEIYDVVAGTFLVVGLGPESFASLPPDMIQKYTEQFKRPELFASINGQIVSVPVEPENPLRTAEMTLELSLIHILQRILYSRSGCFMCDKTDYDNIFKGIVRCADCGRTMLVKVEHRRKRNSVLDQTFYCCSTYRKYGAKACDSHNLEARVLHEACLLYTSRCV